MRITWRHSSAAGSARERGTARYERTTREAVRRAARAPLDGPPRRMPARGVAGRRRVALGNGPADRAPARLLRRPAGIVRHRACGSADRRQRRRGAWGLRLDGLRARNRAHLRRAALGVRADADPAADARSPRLALHARRRRPRRAPRRSARARARAARVHPPRRRRSPLSSRAARARRSASFALGTPLVVRDRGRPPAGAGGLPARSTMSDYKPEWKPHPLRDACRAVGRTLREYALLMRLHKPIGIWLLLWPALWGLWIAGNGRPDPRILFIFTVGVVVTRSAGCVINDYADREFDPRVARTRDRPLAAGRVAPAEALFLFVALGLVAVWLALQLDPYAQLYAVAGAVLAMTYPWLKRIVHVPQFYLGVAFGWSIPMAFAALTGEVPKIAWLLLTAVVLWAAVYDTMYAMVDREDDERIGVKSTAILFGEADRVIVAVMMAMTLFALWLAGNEAGRGDWYRGGLAAAAILFLYELWLIRRREPEACFQAFNNNHYVGLVVFVGLALDYLYRTGG